MHCDQGSHLSKNTAVTVRLPTELKRRLSDGVARTSISFGEIVAELSRFLEDEGQNVGPAQSALGMFAGSAIPRSGFPGDSVAPLGQLAQRHLVYRSSRDGILST
jgi:hypothetical protein